jgi:PDZ domain-containing protein
MTLAVSAGLLLLLLVASATMPVPYIAMTPGPVYDTLARSGSKPVVDVKGHATYPAKGHLYLTTVSVEGAPGYQQLTLVKALRYWVDKKVAVVPREVQYPPGQDNKEVDKRTKQAMIESQDVSVIAALRMLGENASTSRLVVDDVEPGLPAAKALKVGDEITTIDGKPVNTAKGLRDAIRTREPGQSVQIGYLRDGKAGTATLTTVKSDDPTGRAIIGVSPSERCPCKTPYDVHITLGDEVGGPSAGLMFSLGVIDTLTPGDMTSGMSIAGTGTMDLDGQVGPIGGIRQKLIGARRKGATDFLVPEGNWDEANKAIPKGLLLHKVSDLRGAVSEVCRISHATGTPCG